MNRRVPKILILTFTTLIIVINCYIDYRIIIVYFPIYLLIAFSGRKVAIGINTVILICLSYLNISHNCFRIEGFSMFPFINKGDICITSRVLGIDNFKHSRGQIFILKYSNRTICKRLIAITGDTIILKNDIVIFENGDKYEYSHELSPFTKSLFTDSSSYIIPELTNEFLIDGFKSPNLNLSKKYIHKLVFVAGDNKKSSFDSFYFGFVPQELLIRKVIWVFKKGG